MNFVRKAASVGILLFSGTAAFAGNYEAPVADAPIAVPVAPVVSWSGPYAGITGNYNWGDFTSDDSFPGDEKGTLDGGSFGLVLGYDFQNGNMVYGGELNYAFSEINGAENCSNPTFDCGVNVDKVASIRARLGYLATPNTLAYATAGWATANAYGYTDQSGGIGENGETKWIDGWVYGVGLEQKVSDRLNIRGAILRHDFGAADFDTDIRYKDVDIDFTTIELGVIFRF